MRHIGHRHVIGKLKCIVPVLIPIHSPSAEVARVIHVHILVDLLRPPKKFGAFVEQMAIMVDVLYVELESTTADLLDIRLWNFVALLRNGLERRFDSEGLIDV